MGTDSRMGSHWNRSVSAIATRSRDGWTCATNRAIPVRADLVRRLVDDDRRFFNSTTSLHRRRGRCGLGGMFNYQDGREVEG